MSRTKIPWTDETWNPVVGCTKFTAGCKNCYAEKMARRFWKQWGLLAPPHHFGVKWFPERLDIPLRWRKPRKIFVCSMGDLFHEAVPFEFIMDVYAIIANTYRHTYQILTKRPERVLEFYKKYEINEIAATKTFQNIWLGTSISTQADADKNIPILVQIPTAVRFVSIEPILKAPILEEYLVDENDKPLKQIHWAIIGCESGPKARLDIPLRDVEWVIKQLEWGNVPVFVKQIPLNGKCNRNPEEWPEDLRIQEYPKCAARH